MKINNEHKLTIGYNVEEGKINLYLGPNEKNVDFVEILMAIHGAFGLVINKLKGGSMNKKTWNKQKKQAKSN